MDKRAGEDSISILFGALEDLTENSGKMNRSILRSFYLLLAWLIVALILWLLAVIQLNVLDIMAYVLLIAIVILVMIRLVELREKLAIVVAQYQAYTHIRDMSINIPDGSNVVDRFLKFLDQTYGFRERVERRKGKIIRGADINGVKFDLYAEIRKKFMGGMRGIKSYSFYLIHAPGINAKDAERIIKAAVENSKKKKLEIGRIVIITDEVSDDLYDFILNQNIPVQLVMEMEDGTYDFIPFIGPRPDLLP